jgi:hypothetical protein
LQLEAHSLKERNLILESEIEILKKRLEDLNSCKNQVFESDFYNEEYEIINL